MLRHLVLGEDFVCDRLSLLLQLGELLELNAVDKSYETFYVSWFCLYLALKVGCGLDYCEKRLQKVAEEPL